MRLIRSAGDLKPGTRPVFLAIGVFDGVHLGHQQIIHETVSAANLRHAISLVITFDNHPNVVVAPERVPPLIYSLPQKLRTIQSMGVESLLLVHFDQPFSQTTGEEFIRGLAHDLGHIGSVCVGADFTFGHKRSGDVKLLKKMGAELNFDVHAQPAVLLDGKAVSSTRIREVIRAGDLETASRMLGRTYALSGEVIRGDGLGRQLGFPTANLDTTGLVLPPGGVYAAYALLEGARHPAVLNIGYRPTVHDVKPQLRVEAHLLDFEEDLYGKTLDVVFMGRLRDEKKFGSLDELRAQIAQDIAAARKRL